MPHTRTRLISIGNDKNGDSKNEQNNNIWINTNISPITNWTFTTIPSTQNTASVDSIEIQIKGGTQWVEYAIKYLEN